MGLYASSYYFALDCNWQFHSSRTLRQFSFYFPKSDAKKNIGIQQIRGREKFRPNRLLCVADPRAPSYMGSSAIPIRIGSRFRQ